MLYLLLVLLAPEPATFVSTGPTTFKVDGPRLQATLEDLNTLGRQGRIVPQFENGQPAGFKVFGLREDSLYRAMGLQNGDVLRTVSGAQLSSPVAALQLFEWLKTARVVELGITRKGQPLTLTYTIDGPGRTDAPPPKIEPPKASGTPIPTSTTLDIKGELEGAFDLSVGDAPAGVFEVTLPEVKFRDLTLPGGVALGALSLGRVQAKVDVATKAGRTTYRLDVLESLGGDVVVKFKPGGTLTRLTKGKSPRLDVGFTITVTPKYRAANPAVDALLQLPDLKDKAQGDTWHVRCAGTLDTPRCRPIKP